MTSGADHCRHIQSTVVHLRRIVRSSALLLLVHQRWFRLLACKRSSQAGRDDGHTQFVAHVFIKHGADDHRRFGSGKLEAVHHFVQLFQCQAAAGGNVDQHAARTGQIHVFQQRAGNCLLGSTLSTSFAGCGRGAHHGHAIFGHQRAYVGEVHVDHTWYVDHFSNSRHCALQHAVRCLERFRQCGFATQYFHQLGIRHDDQRINISRQFFDAALRQRHAFAFERERLGHDRHGEDAHLLGHLRHDRCRPGSRAATHAGGDEYHVRAADNFGNAFTIFHCRGLADFRLGACAQSLGQGRADLQLHARLAAAQRLRIGIDGDEFDPLHSLVDHVVDGVSAATAHSHHLDHCALRLCIHQFKHIFLLV